MGAVVSYRHIQAHTGTPQLWAVVQVTVHIEAYRNTVGAIYGNCPSARPRKLTPVFVRKWQQSRVGKRRCTLYCTESRAEDRFVAEVDAAALRPS